MPKSSLYSLANPAAQHLWFALLHLICISLSLCAALGCISRVTEYFSTFGIDVQLVAQNLAEVSNGNITDLLHPDLPTTWSFGLSGICIDMDGRPSECHYAFPPLFTIEDLLSKSFASSTDSAVNAVVSNWKQVLAMDVPENTPLGQYQRKHGKFVSLSRLAAALITLSLIFTFTFFILYIVVRPRVAEQYTTTTSKKIVRNEQFYVLRINGVYKEVQTGKIIEVKDGSNIRGLEPGEITAELMARGEVLVVTLEVEETQHQTNYKWRFTKDIWLVLGAAVLDFVLVLGAVLASTEAISVGPGAFTAGVYAGQGSIMLHLNMVLRFICIPIIGVVLVGIAIVVACYLAYLVLYMMGGCSDS